MYSKIRFLKKVAFILLMSIFSTGSAQVNHRYPRIAMFSWGGAPAEWYAKFDLICGRIGDAKFYQEIKRLNPDVLTFYSRDWNVWDASAHGGAPVEWYVRDHAGGKVDVDYGDLMDISNYCTEWDGKKYNERIAEISYQACDTPEYDGFFCEGIWDHPYDTSDVDLDKNGVNDWVEYGRPWLTDKWLEGINETTSVLYPNLRANNKYLILNSGRFHDFEWKNSNGLMLEQDNSSIFSFSHFKGLYDNWMRTAPEPHFLFLDVMESSKDAFKDMRYLLAVTLLGDGYFSFTDNLARSHEYKKYYDEYDLDLGYPASSGLALQNGCWVRFFDNGVSIANPTGTNQTVTDNDLRRFAQYAGPYYRFRGGQDPEINNGSLFGQVAFYGKQMEWGAYGDGIILLRAPSAIVADIILDESDAATSPGSGPAQFIGGWTLDDDTGDDFYQMVFKPWKNFYKYGYSLPGSGENVAIYTPSIGVAGLYEIFEWHGWIGSNPVESVEATNTPYTIAYAEGERVSGTIDQSVNYGKWNSLGQFSFKRGAGSVTLTNKANGKVIADAFKFVLIEAENDTSVIPPSKSIKVSISADDEYILYVNGNYVGSGNNWDVAQTYSIPSREDKNVVAVKGVDMEGVAGLLAEIYYDGKHWTTGPAWKVSKTEHANWDALSFDDSGWDCATIYGKHGEAQPWASYHNVSGISTDPYWIWTADNENDNTVYFRLVLDEDTTATIILGDTTFVDFSKIKFAGAVIVDSLITFEGEGHVYFNISYQGNYDMAVDAVAVGQSTLTAKAGDDHLGDCAVGECRFFIPSGPQTTITLSGSNMQIKRITFYRQKLAGDINHDGVVDGEDLILLNMKFGTFVPAGTPEDLNGDGIVDGEDLIILARNFGKRAK